MSNDAYLDQYIRASEKASQVTRQLAFAGIGVVWIFSGGAGDPKHPEFAGALKWAGLTLVLALGFDFLHAAYSTLAFAAARELRRRRSLQTQVLDNPRWVNWPSLVFFWGKIILVGAAYVFLSKYLIELV